MDYEAVLKAIEGRVPRYFGRGRMAQHIPALRRVPAKRFGMAVKLVDGTEFSVGHADQPISIQSISKVFTLAMALKCVGPRLWRRVGREPSGNPFNSLVQLEYERGIPRNPFINAGALVVTDCVVTHDVLARSAVLDEVRMLSGNRKIRFDFEVARSERTHGHLNFAIAHYLKANNNLVSDVDRVLDVYFHQCSIAMSCMDLARAFVHLANGGRSVPTGEQLLSPRRVKRINALMMTCGLYDAVGNFAYRVGIPAKSGIGGAIVGVIPGVLSVCVWSPELDDNGNSFVGSKALEIFTTRIKKSVF
jgi:glutaminase